MHETHSHDLTLYDPLCLLLLVVSEFLPATVGEHTTHMEVACSFIPVLYVVLHIKVVDQQRVTEFGVTHSLIQWETFWCIENRTTLANK